MAAFGQGDLIFFSMSKLGLSDLVGIACNKSPAHRFRFGSLMRNSPRSKWYCSINGGNRINAKQARQIADELDRLNSLTAGKEEQNG